MIGLLIIFIILPLLVIVALTILILRCIRKDEKDILRDRILRK